jgi:ATP synthase protein I
VTVFLVFAISGAVSAWSAALGGIISIVPNAYFAHRVFRYSGARSMDKVVRSTYQGELMKLLMTGAGFALVFTQVEPLRVSAVFGGFLAMHAVGLWLIVRHFRQRDK